MSASVPEDHEIAVTVIGGYLGAGKTTLVNHILRTADSRVAVLVNDFGDINIDEALIESEDGDTMSLANGCICCSLIDGFASALTTIRELDPQPERLVIEASGVADPAGVAAYGHGPGMALDAVVVVVDGETVETRARDKYVGDTVTGQLASADILVLNKLDLVAERGVEGSEAALRGWLKGHAPNAVVVGATHSQVDPAVLFGHTSSRGGGQTEAHSDSPHSHTHDAESLFESWSRRFAEPVARTQIEGLMEALPDTVVRAKGVLRLVEEPDREMVLQRVGGRWSLRARGHASPAESQLVFIGMRGAIDESWLAQHLPDDVPG